MLTETPSTRPAVQAGRFYDADPIRLRRTIERFLQDCPAPEPGPPPLALLAPHAGYMYSGRIAAHAYRQLQGRQGPAVDHVIILAPSHYVDIEGAALPSHGAFATPLGAVCVDLEAVQMLLAEPHFALCDEAHAYEHSVEVQLPLLQVALGGAFSIVPLTLGRCGPGALESLAASLARFIAARREAGQHWLIVASSDTYHGYDRRACEENDDRLTALIEAMRAHELQAQAEHRKIMACGWMPLVLTMNVAERLGAAQARILERGNSQSEQSATGDYVVGYLAASFG